MDNPFGTNRQIAASFGLPDSILSSDNCYGSTFVTFDFNAFSFLRNFTYILFSFAYHFRLISNVQALSFSSEVGDQVSIADLSIPITLRIPVNISNVNLTTHGLFSI